jgi:hypothetical protein
MNARSLAIAVIGLAAGLLPGAASVAADPEPPPLCSPTTPTQCETDRYTSFVKAFNECGFSKACEWIDQFPVEPSLECYYDNNHVSCDAWPQTWPGTGQQIEYRWTSGGSLSQPYGSGASVSMSCYAPRGGTVTVEMRPPGGTSWTRMSTSISCRTQIER